MFFNVGGYEVLVIAVVALIAIGPEQLPSVMRRIGRTAAQLRSMATGMRDEFMAGLDGVDVTKPEAWFGEGTDADPIVPRGYAQRQGGELAAGTARGARPTTPVNGTEPVDSEPVDAEPVDSEPVDAAPVDLEPVEPEPVDPVPVDPAAVDPEPVNGSVERLESDVVDDRPEGDSEAGGVVASAVEETGEGATDDGSRA